jgi:four helix bundle protein
MRNYKNYEVWTLGMDLVDTIYQLADDLPKNEVYGVRSQITRASVSITLNIAEGCSRSSQKDFKRFLEIAMGSAIEVEVILLILERRNWIKNEMIQSCLQKIALLKLKLGALIKTIKLNINNRS